ncbi:MAG TPA: BON domain-containing protein [Longimicrobiaceae bacterium]|nr:BON domain-containing protein [Longimicrobiaceae bacterium]
MPRYDEAHRPEREMHGPPGRGGGPGFPERDRYDGPAEGPVYGPARYGLGPYYRRLQSRRRPDAELQHDVQEALFYDTWVDAEAIEVEVSDGVVTLRGALPDHDEVRYATDDAWDVDGVRGVRAELHVDSSRRKPLDRVDAEGGARP